MVLKRLKYWTRVLFLRKNTKEMLFLFHRRIRIMQVYNQLRYKSTIPKLSAMKQQFFIALFFLSLSAKAQELSRVTEPASNRAAGSIGFRFDHLIMNEINSSKINYHLIPEIMIGVSKKLTVHGNVFFSNRNRQRLPVKAVVFMPSTGF